MRRKSISKRIRITKNGKIMRRPMATDHSRTRKSTSNIRGKRKSRGLDGTSIKTLSN